MLSAVITALLLCVMLLVIASLIINSLRERRRHMRSLAIQGQLPAHTLDHQVKMMLYMQEGVMTGAEKPVPLPTFTLSTSWYIRHRTFVSISFLVMIFLTLFVQSGLADGAMQNLGKSFSVFSNYQSSDIKAMTHPLPLTASVRLVRVDSAERNQYYSDYQWRTWSYSSCSGISMEEVMNAYGRHFIAADVLQVEQNLGVWDTYNGLLGGEPALSKVANYFGFKASPNPPRTLKDLINVVNKGFPVIVGMPGHIFVVRGGDSNYVYVADSSPANRTVLTYRDFTSIWNGFSVLITPQ